MRLLQITLERSSYDHLFDILEEIEPERLLPVIKTEQTVLVQIIVKASGAEPLMDKVERRLSSAEGFNMMLLPLNATLPRLPDDENTKSEPAKNPEVKIFNRVSREELYASINSGINNLQYYITMVVIACVVAAIGLIRDDIAIIIAAMVIAPLLGPNMALALATTLADKDLAKEASKMGAIGVVLALVISFVIGYFVKVDPGVPAIAARTSLGLSDLVLALSSGIAGALALTAGASSTLIGVMVAVALMPPLVTTGMLWGAGYPNLAMNALLLTAANVICVNLAGVATFVWQGVRPLSWWEKSKAKKASRNAAITWAILVVILVIVVKLKLV